MKELSIEEKARRYDEAIEIAKKINNEHKAQPFDVMLKVFPELAESEDERIKKDIISHFAKGIEGSSFDEVREKYKIWIAWLEKQGEQNYKIIKGKNYLCVKTHNYAGVEWIKGTKYYASDNYTLVNQGCECYCPEYSKEEHNNLFEEVKYDGCVEKQGEQKSVKFKPLFRVGDVIKPKDPVLGEPRIIKGIHPKFGYDTNNGILDFEFEDNWELVEEPVSEELEKEIDNYISSNFFGSQTMGFFANRTKEEPNDRDMALCAKHFFELGLKAKGE